ncbi:Abi-like protein [[Clostridium] methylpentosum DSM 5476]|uniref:Abi-like protein n=1 Tax=[Clostridium] methylpentosum DSM 5476 TaxID=537013 RepID=C0EAX2_9FIRM|nr:Abi-like protein [[Clostridium] methylpentosum DSM 5476]MDY3989344.1 Abi family protein [Massilioclostridium sp.]MEE1492466.1 Abi family protein [Massilioclostridium sp.]
MEKPKLSIDEQISHMRDNRGIKFNIVNEQKAKEYLMFNSYYFRIKSYAKNFDKYKNGPNKDKYINLEFAYLQELSTLDMYLRKFILRMTIDIEHFLKTQLLKDFVENQQEDGYSIINKLLSNYPYIKDNIDRRRNSYVCCNLINKFNKDFAIWNIVEVLSFGDFINLYNLYYKEYNSTNNLSNYLWSVKFLRNAAAHNNCLLNSLKTPYSSHFNRNKQINTIISKIPNIGKTQRITSMNNPVIHDLVVTLYVFNRIANKSNIKRNTMIELKELIDNRFTRNKNYFNNNDVISSYYNFFKKIVDFYYSKVV